MNICYLCGDPLTNKNRSQEHILPNSIGGKLKCADLLCQTCNEQTGLLFDDIFALFAGPLASKYNIKRDRGVVQNIIAKEKGTGLDVIVKPGFQIDFAHPKVTQMSTGGALIEANTMKRFKQAVEQLRKAKNDEGMAFEIGEIIVDNTPKKIDFVIDVVVNQDAVLRSVCKTLCNYYYFKTNDRLLIAPLIAFLTTEIENFYSWFFDLNLVAAYHGAVPYHLLVIRGDKKQKAVYAYLEIFGEKGFVTLVNGNYRDIDFTMSYTFDPISRKEIPANYDFQLKVGELIRVIQSKPGL